MDPIRLANGFPEFRTKTSIRQKIIAPFVLIVIGAAALILWISITLIDQYTESQFKAHLELNRSVIRENIDERLKKTGFYAQFAADMKKSVSKIGQKRSEDEIQAITLQILNQDNTHVYWDMSDLSDAQKEKYAALIQAGKQGRQFVDLQLRNDSGRLVPVAVGVGSDKRENQYFPVIAEYELGSRALDELKSRLNLDMALVFRGEIENRPMSVFLGGTDLFMLSQELQHQVKDAVARTPEGMTRPIELSAEDSVQEYRLWIEPMPINSNILLVTVIPAAELQTAKRQIILVTIGILAAVLILIITIYTVIVRHITRSLEALSDGARQVAQGDFEHQVEVQSTDEIGGLAVAFNEMVDQVKKSTSTVIAEKNRTESIIASLPAAIIVTDRDNRLLLANQFAEKLFHFSLEDGVGRHILDSIHVPEVLEVIEDQYKQNHKQINREIKYLFPGSKEKTLVFSSILTKSSEGEAIGVTTVIRDVTHERELDELRDSFLRTVSHELRTPLTSVIGFIDLVVKSGSEKLTKSQKDYLEIALKGANDLKNLINDLLDLSRIEAGKVRLVLTEIPIATFLEDLRVSFLPLADSRKLSLNVSVTTPDLIVVADQEKLRRVILNLVSNAIKFTEVGGITITCMATAQDVVFSVSDTGIGLLEDERDIIFDKFRQADYSSTRRYEGIGLGLSIVRELIELHGGHTWVESEYKKGSTFSFSIPRSPRATIGE